MTEIRVGGRRGGARVYIRPPPKKTTITLTSLPSRMSKRAASSRPLDGEPQAKKAKIIGSPQDAPIFDLLSELFTNHVLPHLGHLDRVLLSLTCKYYYERKSPVILKDYTLIAACALSGICSLFHW